MKLPFSYKSDTFRTMLIPAVIVHGLILGGSGILSPSPKYSVKDAPSSVQIVLLKEEPKEKSEKLEDEVMTTIAPSPDSPEVSKNELNSVQEPKAVTPKSAEAQGALTEAVPDAPMNKAPVYPRIAREKGWEGRVLVRVHVGKDGRPGEVEIAKTSGYRILDNAAVKAISKWTFHPARIGNIKYASWVTIPVRFLLKDGRS